MLCKTFSESAFATPAKAQIFVKAERVKKEKEKTFTLSREEEKKKERGRRRRHICIIALAQVIQLLLDESRSHATF